MFDKITTFKIDRDGVEILDGELIKTAALKLPDGIEYDPDFFYARVRAVSAGEYWGNNKNFDYFPEEELKKSYKTFLNAHVFKNHENKDIANAIGDVLDATWDDGMKCVILLIRIDRRIAPSIVRGFQKGFMTDVSMGCRIQYSVCPICGNKAKTKLQFCDHIKYMRGKIFDDGRKVYEINIGPKFHDISAVLNGAEKSAKIQDMVLDEKLASKEDTCLEKAASFEEVFTMSGGLVTEKAVYEEDLPIFEKKASKSDYLQKVAEIKKEIQGKIISIAKGELLSDKSKSINSVSKIIKLLYTDYWNKDKCQKIAVQLKNLANEKQAPLEVVFHQFLKVLDFAGIDLSPLEMHDIYHELIGSNTPDLRMFDDKMVIPPNIDDFMDNIDNLEDAHSLHGHVNIPTMFNTIHHGVLPNLSTVNGLDINPANKLKAVVIRVKMPTPEINDDLMYNDIMSNIVQHLMPSRSSHRKFIIKRFSDIADGKIEPRKENVTHFLPAHLLQSNKVMSQMAPFILSALMHANYENERVAHFSSDDFDYGLNKFASYINDTTTDNLLNELIVDKTAAKKYGLGKAMFIGLPATYAYSALQRARINNGDNVNNLNRYVAENPGNAGLIQMLFGPTIAKGVKGKINSTNAKMLNKYASEEGFLSEIYKQADVGEDNFMYEKDMFKDSCIDNALNQVYNSNQVTTLKQACLLNFMDREDLATEMLLKVALNESDLDKYLKIAKDSIKIEIEKNASELPQLVKGTIVNGTFHTTGKSTLAALPGLGIDAAAFLWLDKKMRNKKIKE